MEDIINHGKAAAILARLDEGLNRSTYVDIYKINSRRREAFCIAQIDGANPVMDNLCRIICDRNEMNIDKGSRIAFDVYNAIFAIENLNENLSSEDILQTFMISDESSSRLLSTDVMWNLEEDAMWVASLLETLAENPNFSDSITTFKSIWNSGRFLGHARKMACLFSPLIWRYNFDITHNLWGVTSSLLKNIDLLRQSETHLWEGNFLEILISSMKKELEKLNNIGAERTSILLLCPIERTSSSVERVVDFMFEYPIFSTSKIAKSLDLTARGVKIITDKMIENNILVDDGKKRNKQFICRRTM